MDLIILDGHDVPDPQNMAMLQALYSRDPSSVKDQLNKLRNVSKFMDNYVVKYGHGSIAQCGYITIFAEKVSMYLAKIIEHHNYYCGQETSSRYVNFADQGCVAPSPAYAEIQKQWLAIYEKALAERRDLISVMNFGTTYASLSEADKKKVNPKAFDFARGFLPFGAKTNVSWTTNFDNLWKHLSWIKENFVFQEAQDFVKDIETQIRAKYPDSFPALLGEKGTGASRENMGNSSVPILHPMTMLSNSTKYDFVLRDSSDLKIELKNHLMEDVTIVDSIDLGSWRDLQRHRNTLQAWPEWLNELHDFYIEGLSLELTEEINNLWKKIVELIYKGNLNSGWKDESWYALPLAVKVSFGLKMSVYQMFYIIRARYQETVHPTAREMVATWLSKYIDNRQLKNSRVTYSYDDFLEAHNLRKNVVESARTALGEDKYLLSIKRAEQTIEEKK